MAVMTRTPSRSIGIGQQPSDMGFVTLDPVLRVYATVRVINITSRVGPAPRTPPDTKLSQPIPLPSNSCDDGSWRKCLERSDPTHSTTTRYFPSLDLRSFRIFWDVRGNPRHHLPTTACAMRSTPRRGYALLPQTSGFAIALGSCLCTVDTVVMRRSIE